MIARAHSRPRPIPFLDPLQQAEGGGDVVMSAELARPAPHTITTDRGLGASDTDTRLIECTTRAAPQAPAVGPGPDHAAPRHRARREVLVRHDGDHPVSVRSAATGHHYRFEACGGTQWVDAADIALLRRIAHMHIG